MVLRSFAVCLLLAACGKTASAPVEKNTATPVTQVKFGGPFPEGASAVIGNLSNNTTPICTAKNSGIHCHAVGRQNTAGKLWTAPYPIAGFAPADLQAAYNVPTSGGKGVTVALIEYGDDPTAEDDLAVYRAAANMKACTTANGCFRKVTESGELIPSQDSGTNGAASQPVDTPAPDYDWAVETSLDLDMVSAGCPNCNILLVEASEANTNWFDDAGTAMTTAVTLGANAISNSWGTGEDAALVGVGETYFNKPGVSVFVSSGDSGFDVVGYDQYGSAVPGASYPASSQYVIAVGGTNLSKTPSTSRGWTESTWNEGSSACSAYINKPSWQTDSVCQQRMVADVAAVGDPATPVAVYLNYYGEGGVWTVVGGTSVAAPLSAAMWAASGLAGTDASWVYSHTQDFNDVVAGSNGQCNDAPYECAAGPGYDGPTGWGSINATASVAPASPVTAVSVSPSTISSSGTATLNFKSTVAAGGYWVYINYETPSYAYETITAGETFNIAIPGDELTEGANVGEIYLYSYQTGWTAENSFTVTVQ